LDGVSLVTPDLELEHLHYLCFSDIAFFYTKQFGDWGSTRNNVLGGLQMEKGSEPLT